MSGKRFPIPLTVLALATLLACGGPAQSPEVSARFIVQATDADAARAAVIEIGGTITHELGIIRAVGAELTPSQVRALEAAPGVQRVFADRTAHITGKPGSSTPQEEPVCEAADAGLLSFSRGKVVWPISNTGNIKLTIDRLDISWASTNGDLREIKLGRDTLVSQNFAPDVASISTSSVATSERQIADGRSSDLSLAFDQTPSSRQSDYRITVHFAEGCSAAYVPGGKGLAASEVPDGYVPDTFVPRWLGADTLWQQGITGDGVTVAVLDTTTKYTLPGLKQDTSDLPRVPAFYDAVADVFCDSTDPDANCPGDAFGHGTHVAGIIVNSAVTDFGHYGGIAPDADLVVVRALGDDGSGTYLDVIRGIQWVVLNKDIYDIRVLNLSLSAPPQSHYWDDPLNQAVMAAWQAGIVVVASAGNTGPEAMTIGVPGNVPYVITVGATSDHYTPHDDMDDFLTSFSSTGPTVEGFVKPEVVAPGGHVISNMQDSTQLAGAHAEYQFGSQYFQMSGTSQATAAASGVVALMLQADPTLTPDEVKCRLMASARPAVDEAGRLAYSVFQQGAGMVDAPRAVASTATVCANRGLDVTKDLLGLEHYGGRANQDPVDESYYIMGLEGEGYLWSDHDLQGKAYLWGDGYLWSDAYLWNDGYIWADAYLWNDGYLWSDAYLWGDSFVETATAAPLTVDTWVEQE